MRSVLNCISAVLFVCSILLGIGLYQMTNQLNDAKIQIKEEQLKNHRIRNYYHGRLYILNLELEEAKATDQLQHRQLKEMKADYESLKKAIKKGE